MSWYGNRLPSYISDTTEDRVQKKLAAISLGIGEKLEIVSIYPRGGKVYVWYFLDISKAGKLPPELKEVTKPIKKTRTRKTGK